MSLARMLFDANYGEPRFNVKFNDIQCRKSEFSNCCSSIDIDEIEKYGLAIHTAKAFKEEEWSLTERSILVRGRASRLSTLQVSISVDKNLLFLLSQDIGKIKGGYAVEVLIEGPDVFREETATVNDAPRGIIFGPLK